MFRIARSDVYQNISFNQFHEIDAPYNYVWTEDYLKKFVHLCVRFGDVSVARQFKENDIRLRMYNAREVERGSEKTTFEAFKAIISAYLEFVYALVYFLFSSFFLLAPSLALSLSHSPFACLCCACLSVEVLSFHFDMFVVRINMNLFIRASFLCAFCMYIQFSLLSICSQQLSVLNK